jgi:hypothetical protein
MALIVLTGSIAEQGRPSGHPAAGCQVNEGRLNGQQIEAHGRDIVTDYGLERHPVPELVTFGQTWFVEAEVGWGGA